MDEKSFEPFDCVMQRIHHALQTIDALPDTVPPELGTSTCRCPVKYEGCDGYGHVEKGGQAYACPHLLRRQAEESLKKHMQSFEDWPPLRFKELAEKEWFVKTFTFQSAVEMLKQIRQGKRKGSRASPRALLSCFGYGRGKTYTGLQLILECHILGLPVCAIHMPSLRDLSKEGHEGNEARKKIFRRMRNSDFVFVDELFRSQHETDLRHEVKLLEEMLRMCYLKKWLYLTTNLPNKLAKKLMEGYCASRLSDRGPYCVSRMEPGDMDFRQIHSRKNPTIQGDIQGDKQRDKGVDKGVDIPGMSTWTKAQKEGTSTGTSLGTGEGRP